MTGKSMEVPLRAMVECTDGPILELGCGPFSTPFLHDLCSPSERELYSLDHNGEWVKTWFGLRRPWHKVLVVKGWDDCEILTRCRWSVVLVDNWPSNTRAGLVRTMEEHADIIVVHDTEDHVYGFEPELKEFAWRYDHSDVMPQTTIVSDVFDVNTHMEKLLCE